MYYDECASLIRREEASAALLLAYRTWPVHDFMFSSVSQIAGKQLASLGDGAAISILLFAIGKLFDYFVLYSLQLFRLYWSSDHNKFTLCYL